MCYLVAERYSVCNCLHYRHGIDKCAAYGDQGHVTQERTVLVGYPCNQHSLNDDDEEKTWVWAFCEKPGFHVSNAGLPKEIWLKGVRITSAIALSALQDAQLMEGDDTSTKAIGKHTADTASTRIMVEDETRHEAKVEDVKHQSARLDDLRSRLLHPSQYVTSLQTLEETIWNNSVISIYTGWNSDSPASEIKSYGSDDYIPYPVIPAHLQNLLPKALSDDNFATDPTNTSDNEITNICQTAKDRGMASWLNAIRMCRNVIVKTFLNLKLLQQNNFCAGSFSAIVAVSPEKAILQPVESTDFVALIFEIEYILRDVASIVLQANLAWSHGIFSMFPGSSMVEKYCQTLLHDRAQHMDSLYDFAYNTGKTLRPLVVTLDLAVASYAGAHCSDFPSEISAAVDGLCLLDPFDDCTALQKANSTVFRRCHLKCLDAFHNGKAVWVFWPSLVTPTWPSLPLYLSATIDAFSDIWGPLWKLKDQGHPDKYSAYVVGGGSIVQWESPPSLYSEMAPGEVFCHWISNEDLETNTRDSPEHSQGFTYKLFDGTERLLIGAPNSTPTPASRELWSPNLNCSVSISEARQRLQEAKRLCIVGASKPYHYNESNEYQLQVGYSGVNASATRQYKRVPGQSLKEVLVELWAMLPELRDPTLLDDLHGVEISICTSNAQRVSLTHILRSNCMRHLLREYSWKDPGYCEEYFLTLQDTLRPKRLLDSQFKKKFDYAIMLGLKMLSKTGVDRDGNLQVFLSSKCTPKPELASITSKEHTWVGLLRDTTTECAMVAFGDSCLEFKYNDCVSCGIIGHSALRSAIILHSKEVSVTEVGKSFSLGERGSLRLKAKLGGDMMVMEWSCNSVKMAVKNRLGRDLIHREYTEVDHSGEGGMSQPLPVIVVSDRSGGPV